MRDYHQEWAATRDAVTMVPMAVEPACTPAVCVCACARLCVVCDYTGLPPFSDFLSLSTLNFHPDFCGWREKAFESTFSLTSSSQAEHPGARESQGGQAKGQGEVHTLTLDCFSSGPL